MKASILLCSAAMLFTGCLEDRAELEAVISELEVGVALLSDEWADEAVEVYDLRKWEMEKGYFRKEEFATIDSVHDLATEFHANARLAMQDSLSTRDIMLKYQRTFDYIKRYAPDLILEPQGFEELKKNASTKNLMVMLMNADIAQAELSVQNYLAGRFRNSVIKDDFQNQPVAREVTTGSDKTSFSVNFKYLQQFPDRRITIESLLHNGKSLTAEAAVTQDDLLGIVSFSSLKPGNYKVKGNVKAMTRDGLQGGPFEYEFTVK